MKLDRTSLRSKVARRICVLFIICALLPAGVLAYVSFSQVSNHLNEQGQRRLHQASKALGLSVYERLLFLEAEMTTVASVLPSRAGPPRQRLTERIETDLIQKFTALALATPDGHLRPFLGRMDDPPELTSEEKQHVSSGKILVFSRHGTGLQSRVFMGIGFDSRLPVGTILLAEINPAYLWGISARESMPSTTALCVFDQWDRVLICSAPVSPLLGPQVAMHVRRSASGHFEWSNEGETYLAGYWSLPLKFRFHAPPWTVVFSESKAHTLAPLRDFQKTFPLVILMSLGVVLLLSTSQLRRQLLPLEELQEGIRRIARRQFESPVTVSSGDEFEELAASLNTMARQLKNQFSTLSTMVEIDRAILSALDTEKILETIPARVREILPCDQASVLLFDREGGTTARLYSRDGSPEGRTEVKSIPLKPEELEPRCSSHQVLFIPDEDPSHPLVPLFTSGIKAILAMPIFLSQRLSGMIALGYRVSPSVNDEDLLQARQFADRVAVAIHNSQLYEKTKRQAEELERANRVKDEFLSVMSHELRTPLTAVIGYAEMVREKSLGEINPQQENALAMVKTRSLDLLNMINSILQASWMGAETLAAERQAFNLRGFLADFKSVYRLPLEKHINVIWDYPDDLPAVKTDSVKLRQILQNLIDNAIKFTEQGSVKISARCLPESNLMEFKVADTGIGIPKEALPNIFKQFYQVDSSETRHHGGVGLGLYLVDRFADLLGGKIDVESELGKGSTFTLTLPYEA